MTEKKILLKKKGITLKGKALFAMLIMVSSALIVTGSAWSFRDPKPYLAVQVGDIEQNSCESPWDEFTEFTAPPYEIDYTAGDCPNQFPQKTAKYCSGVPNEVNIHFTCDMERGGIVKFRWSPGYNGHEVLKFYLDGRQVKVIRDKGGHDPNEYCTHKMSEFKFRLPKDRLGEVEHTLTILHHRGNGGLWDWLQIWQYKPLPKSNHQYTIKLKNPLACSDGFVPGKPINIKFQVFECNKMRWVHDESVTLKVFVEGEGCVYKAKYGGTGNWGDITIKDPPGSNWNYPKSKNGLYSTVWQTQPDWAEKDFWIKLVFDNGYTATFK